MALPPYLKTQGDRVLLHAKVQPRAPRNEVGEPLGAELKIRIAAPPVDSAANDALIEFLAETIDCPRHAVQIVRGAASRHKVIAIRGVAAGVIQQRLAAR
jgi:uncharacterized protein (TIGR00251 family)